MTAIVAHARTARAGLSPAGARLLLVLLAAAAFLAGWFATSGHDAARAAAAAGGDLTRLLRAMALLKAMMAAGLIAAVLWRLGSAAGPAWFALYALACAAMAAGPALIWNMDAVGLGALLLHGGLVAAAVLLWRDKAVAARLSAMIARRRQVSAQR